MYNKMESLSAKTAYLEEIALMGGFNEDNQRRYLNMITPFEELLDKDLKEWHNGDIAGVFKCLGHLSGTDMYWLFMTILTYFDTNNVAPNPALSLHGEVVRMVKLK